MPSYTPPTRDMQFVLHEVLNVSEQDVPGYAELEPDFTAAVLEEAGKIASEGLMPLNANDTLLEFGAPELTHSVDHVIIWGWENGNQTATDEARSWFEAHADVFRGEARAARRA